MKYPIGIQSFDRIIENGSMVVNLGFRFKKIYNSFSLLNVFTSQCISDYWFRSGMPTYFICLLSHTIRG